MTKHDLPTTMTLYLRGDTRVQVLAGTSEPFFAIRAGRTEGSCDGVTIYLDPEHADRLVAQLQDARQEMAREIEATAILVTQG